MAYADDGDRYRRHADDLVLLATTLVLPLPVSCSAFSHQVGKLPAEVPSTSCRLTLLPCPALWRDRKIVVEGTSMYVRVALGVRRIFQNKKTQIILCSLTYL